MGVNFDGLTMDQKRQQLRDMTKGTMLGGINPELPTPINLPEVAAAGASATNPMMALSALQGLLSEEPQQLMPIIQQQAVPGLNNPIADMSKFYGGMLNV